jgi:lipopolysaccharide transport system ATP-binding protein
VNILNPLERYCYRYRVEFQQHAETAIFGWLVKTTSGLELGGGAHANDEAYIRDALAGSVYEVCFEFTACLYPGIYYLNCGVSGTVDQYHGFLHRVIDAVAFRVRKVYSKVHTGYVDFDYRAVFRLVKSGEDTLATVQSRRDK